MRPGLFQCIAQSPMIGERSSSERSSSIMIIWGGEIVLFVRALGHCNDVGIVCWRPSAASWCALAFYIRFSSFLSTNMQPAICTTVVFCFVLGDHEYSAHGDRERQTNSCRLFTRPSDPCCLSPMLDEHGLVHYHVWCSFSFDRFGLMRRIGLKV